MLDAFAKASKGDVLRQFPEQSMTSSQGLFSTFQSISCGVPVLAFDTNMNLPHCLMMEEN